MTNWLHVKVSTHKKNLCTLTSQRYSGVRSICMVYKAVWLRLRSVSVRVVGGVWVCVWWEECESVCCVKHASDLETHFFWGHDLALGGSEAAQSNSAVSVLHIHYTFWSKYAHDKTLIWSHSGWCTYTLLPWVVDWCDLKVRYSISLQHLRQHGLHLTVVITALLLQLQELSNIYLLPYKELQCPFYQPFKLQVHQTSYRNIYMHHSTQVMYLYAVHETTMHVNHTCTCRLYIKPTASRCT